VGSSEGDEREIKGTRQTLHHDMLKDNINPRQEEVADNNIPVDSLADDTRGPHAVLVLAACTIKMKVTRNGNPKHNETEEETVLPHSGTSTW